MNGEWASSTDRDYKLGFQRSPEYYKAANTFIFNAVEAGRLAGHDDKRANVCLESANTARQFLRDYEKQHT